ncbi:MAG: dTDP-4-dehydrorhamnose reductase [Neisseria sp.]|nr:dTDP-4-dehydrorhamnose reductase [Neisseria sp.]
MKILLTGANGQLGWQLQKLWQNRADVEVLAHDKNGLDISDWAAVQTASQTFRPDFIVNAAAYTAVDKAESESDLAYQINELGVANLARAAQEVGATFIHVSTDYVFAGDGERAYREDDAVAPQSVYGKSKLAGEKAALAACANSFIVRTAWVFGEHGNNFVKTMLRLGKERPELGIVADQIGCPTYAGDLAAALIAMTDHIASGKTAPAGIYHYAGAQSVSWFEFAQAIFQAANEQGMLEKVPTLKAISTADYPTPARRPANSRLDCQKIAATFGVQASDWRAALNDLRAYI